MLECGKNFKGSLREVCQVCNVLDNENHRLNYCSKFRHINRCDSDEKIPFESIYSTDVATVKQTIEVIEKTWNTKNAHGTMSS